MKKVAKLTHERLLEVLDYDPATGVFAWRVRSSNRIRVGDRAGVVGTNGHRFIMIEGEKFQASRLAWFYVNKVWPEHDVKFGNGKPDDCSIDNLKDMSRIDAARERGLISVNTSGYAGVSRAKGDRWQAKITWNYEQINLGASFESAKDASEVYEEAARRLKAGVESREDRDRVVTEIRTWQRQRTVWNHLNRNHTSHGWNSFEHFCETIKEFPEARFAMVAVDVTKQIGPANFQWTMPISEKRGMVGSEYNRAVRDTKRDHVRNKDFRKNYGIDFAQYQEMLLAQKGVCAICEKPETKIQNGTIRLLSVDHDHATGAPRGLLCGNCNLAIGYACDDVTILRKAIGYLNSHKKSDNVIPFNGAMSFGA